MKRYVLNPDTVPLDVAQRILDRGAVYPAEHYPVGFGTHYNGFVQEGRPDVLNILDSSGSFQAYPAAWFSEVVPKENGFELKPVA